MNFGEYFGLGSEHPVSTTLGNLNRIISGNNQDLKNVVDTIHSRDGINNFYRYNFQCHPTILSNFNLNVELFSTTLETLIKQIFFYVPQNHELYKKTQEFNWGEMSIESYLSYLFPEHTWLLL